MKKNANLPVLIFTFALLIIWQAGAMGMNAAYILPSPTQIVVRLWELRKPLFTAHLPATMLCTGVGLAISVALGLLLAIVMDASPAAERMLYPLIIASQTIPTTALAPLFVLWFGYTIWSKVLVTVLITFFPIAMTVFDGFRSAKTDMVDMLKTFGAGKKDRVKQAFRFQLTLCLGYTTIFWLLMMLVPGAVAGIFTSDASLIDYTTWAMRIYMAGIFSTGVQIACQQSFMALGQAKVSLLLACLRKLILLIPLIFILPHVVANPVFGVFLAEPVSDIIAAAVTATTFFLQFNKILDKGAGRV